MRRIRKNKKKNASVSQNSETPFFSKVQKKLSVGKAGDKYEVEADQMADKVVSKQTENTAIQKMDNDDEIQEKPLSKEVTSLQKQELKEEEPVQKVEEEESVQKTEEEAKEESIQKKEEEETVQEQEEEEAVQQKTNGVTAKNPIESQLKSSKGKGHVMDSKTKIEMEQGFGADFSAVKIHTDTEAKNLSNDLGAQAFTTGNDVYFNEGKYNPNTQEGKHLLAHELTHTLQQNKGTNQILQKKVDPKAPTIKSYLSRSFFDWAVTDHDARMSLIYLTNIHLSSKEDFYDTVQDLDAGGYIDELNAETTDADKIAYSNIFSLIQRITSDSLSTYENILYRPRFNWITSSAIAQDTFNEIKSGAISTITINEIISNLSFEQFSNFIDLIPETDNQDDLRLIQRLTIANSGETLRSLARKQRAFLVAEAASEGKSVEEYLTAEVTASGYGGESASDWNALSPAIQQDWRDRFDVVYQDLQDNAIQPIKDLIENAIAQGGGIKFDEASCEEEEAFAYSEGTYWLTVGISFVKKAEQDISYVYANIAHEIGHDDYGDEYSFEVISGALTADEINAAENSGNSLFSSYGYPEGEIYGELREQSYIVEGENPTDYPENDIEDKLNRIKRLYEPDVAYTIVWSLRNRIHRDATISAEAKELFNTLLNKVFPEINEIHRNRIAAGN